MIIGTVVARTGDDELGSSSIDGRRGMFLLFWTAVLLIIVLLTDLDQFLDDRFTTGTMASRRRPTLLDERPQSLAGNGLAIRSPVLLGHFAFDLVQRGKLR
jgi:hypothetical protein